jgi:acetyl coenzyme A synthetase (ADP forming)-like protein
MEQDLSRQAAYLADREADVVLRDGSTVRVRPVLRSDEGALLELLRKLSPEARSYRFFSGGVDLEQAARWAAEVDYRDSYGLVATTGGRDRVVAHAVFSRVGGGATEGTTGGMAGGAGDGKAEVAFAIADELQGRGLGTILFAHLAEAAEERGISTFEAEVMPGNERMLQVFRDSGFPVEMRSEPGAVVVESPTSLSPEAVERFERREQIAALTAMRRFLAPGSVAVVGASRERGTVGGELFHNLVATGFNGPVYPVNPRAEVVQSVPAYSSLEGIPREVEIAVVAVPAPAVLEVAEQCAEAGVKGLVVISAGFAEAGPEGSERQRELVALCRRFGMRLIGPNCMGILNTAEDVRLNATFGPQFPPSGKVGFLSQSGALGLAVIDFAGALGLGLSSFVSVGNKADISGNDLIEYWESDEQTGLILLYLESFGNPRRFARIARRVGCMKPIVAVKSGRSGAGARATSSHTGAMVAASDVTVDALFRQAGVIRTDTLHELFNVASLLTSQPLPRGKRVAILTNAGGPAILCADACEGEGLEVLPPPESVQAALSTFLPDGASTSNPIDMLATAPPEHYQRAIRLLGACEDVDALIVIFIPPLVTTSEEVATAIRPAVAEVAGRIPVLPVFMSREGVPPSLREGDPAVPAYSFPEDAARALARVARYADWRSAPRSPIREFEDTRATDAARVIASALAEGHSWLEPTEVAELLECYGVPLVEWRIARSPEGARTAAAELGGEVALKAIARGLLHKSEHGAVRLGLGGGDVVEGAASAMARELERGDHEVEGFIVQRMAPAGEEMIVGVVGDPVFGPVVACGAGGVTTELLRDVAVRITPLTEADAREMVRSLRTFPLLEGYRGRPRADVEALEETLMRVSSLVEAHAEVVEMDLNPVIVGPGGVVVVDARVRVEPPPPRRPWPALA